MHDLVRGGDEPGLLAYQDGQPVGWVSIGPRESFGHLTRSRRYGPTEDEPGVYAVVCFYVHASARRQGLEAVLLDAALELARERGARAVEAYPHERPDYMGHREVYERRGFQRVRDAAPRVVMRLGFAGA